MRIIDVACATSFAITSILVLLAINPGAMRQQTHGVFADARADDLVQRFLEHYDLNFLATSNLASICTSAESFSNQSAHILVRVDGWSCQGSAHPGIYDGSSTTTLNLNGRMVTIEGWVQEKP